MTPETFFGALLIILISGLGLVSVAAADTFTAILSFFAYGILLSMAWMALAAPDVALTEAALGSGVTGALLLGARARLRNCPRARPTGPAVKAAAAVLCAGLSAALAAVVLLLPVPPPSLAPQVLEALPPTGLRNPVTAVLMVFRGLDTLLEKVVLLLALIGIYALAARPAEAVGTVTPPPLTPPAMAGPLAFLTRNLAPAGFIAGVYLFWVGADEPGSAFAGGALISAMVLLVVISGAARMPGPGRPAVRLATILGIVVFLSVGFGGSISGAGFLVFPPGLAKPLIVLIEVAMIVSIGATLAMLVAGPPRESKQP